MTRLPTHLAPSGSSVRAALVELGHCRMHFGDRVSLSIDKGLVLEMQGQEKSQQTSEVHLKYTTAAAMTFTLRSKMPRVYPMRPLAVGGRIRR